jgi:hypothetical protein
MRRVSLRVIKFWVVLKTAMMATKSCHFGRRPGVWGRSAVV